MRDIWAFLLQTLTASGAAVLLLAVKAMFRDKLSPRWQFSAWGILALMLLIPAGLGGRYALVNWPFYVEAVKSALTGEYGTLTKVLLPIPLPPSAAPQTAADWLYVVYAAGAVLLLARYAVSYIRLRLALKGGKSADDGFIRDTAARYGLPVCPAVEVEGLPSAFICGVFRPVLALPAGAAVDEKVLLHELLHLKHRDTAWGLVIGFFRCIHWCNPLLWLCADLAGNDLESLCDQRVLEQLEGEARRDYGRILLSMADEKYARAPGTSSMANGGRNIRRRIQAIARFKRYPRGMGLVSVCVALVIAAPLLVGQRAGASYTPVIQLVDQLDADMAAARTTRCTTYAGAFDAYAKAVLKEYIPYRAMCAPLAEQNALAQSYRREAEQGTWGWADAGLPGSPFMQDGYYIYNLAEVEENVWEGLLAVRLQGQQEEAGAADSPYIWLAIQRLRAKQEGDRWVVLPQEDFHAAEAAGWTYLPSFGCDQLPSWLYEGSAEDFTIQLRRQTSARVNSTVQNGNGFFSSTSFDLTPQPDGEFTGTWGTSKQAVYTGGAAEKDLYTHFGLTTFPLREGQARPEMENPGLQDISGSSNTGASWSGYSLEKGWDSPILLGGGGGSGEAVSLFPAAYAADLYLNGELAAQLTLLPSEEGGMSFD